jgi:hypothetical protein
VGHPSRCESIFQQPARDWNDSRAGPTRFIIFWRRSCPTQAKERLEWATRPALKTQGSSTPLCSGRDDRVISSYHVLHGNAKGWGTLILAVST